LGIGLLDGFKTGESAIVVEIVEVLVGFVNLRRQVDGVGVGGGVSVAVCFRQRCVRQQESQNEEGDFYPAFYCCFSEARLARFGSKGAVGWDDTGRRLILFCWTHNTNKLYPLVPTGSGAPVLFLIEQAGWNRLGWNRLGLNGLV
jgi:hypothetical protein